MTAGSPAISFRDLRKCYGSVAALDGLSLDVSAGEIVGMIGPDGAGKSTAMRIACALLRPDSGSVRVAGFDPTIEPVRVKERIGYMPQRFSLYPDLSVSENLRFFADLYGVPRLEMREREERLMHFSRLDPFRRRRAGQLSGGMKQKLALSCTLIHAPDVLLLDEPTTGVDPVSRQEFWTILKELASSGKALLISTPYMDEAGLCDRVALMHRGRTLAMGSPREIPRHFRRRLIEITGERIHEAAARLERFDAGVAVHRVGGRLHVVYDDDGQSAKLREELAGLALKVEAVEPSIEETLIYLMEHEEAAA